MTLTHILKGIESEVIENSALNTLSFRRKTLAKNLILFLQIE